MHRWLLTDLFVAYYDARRNKRNSLSQLEFELHYESNLITLGQELIDGTYTISKNICFLICDTVPREVFAPDFRDRVVHHLIINKISNVCDDWFIHDSYSCRIGKWTHYGVKRLDHFVRSSSANYSRDSRILKLDIKWFFMGIEKELLLYLIRQTLASKKSLISWGGIDSDEYFMRLWDLIKKVTLHDPTQFYQFIGSRELYKHIPSDKSLFTSSSWCGIPIGNLTSQLFANIYLHSFDLRVKQVLWCAYYGRYVDDFVIVHQDKNFLTSIIPLIKNYLAQELGLTLHPKKIYLQHYIKGVKFLGAYLKPHRIYINRRTIGNAQRSFRSIRNNFWSYTKYETSQAHSTIHSYLGMMQHYRNYKQRKKITSLLPESYPISSPFTKLNNK